MFIFAFSLFACKAKPLSQGGQSDVVTVGELAEKISYSTIKLSTNDEQYTEVSEPGWNTGKLELDAQLTIQNAQETIDLFLKEHLYSLHFDIMSELSISEDTNITEEYADEICNRLSQKIKDTKPLISLDINNISKIEISDKSDIDNPKELAVTTSDDIARLGDYLNKTPIDSVKYAGISTGTNKTVSVYDKANAVIFSISAFDSGFVKDYSQYSVAEGYLTKIFSFDE